MFDHHLCQFSVWASFLSSQHDATRINCCWARALAGYIDRQLRVAGARSSISAALRALSSKPAAPCCCCRPMRDSDLEWPWKSFACCKALQMQFDNHLRSISHSFNWHSASVVTWRQLSLHSFGRIIHSAERKRLSYNNFGMESRLLAVKSIFCILITYQKCIFHFALYDQNNGEKHLNNFLPARRYSAVLLSCGAVRVRVWHHPVFH